MTPTPTDPVTAEAAAGPTEQGARTHTVAGSPLGDLVLVAEGGALTGVYFARQHRGRPGPEKLGERDDTEPVLAAAGQQLAEFFAGNRREFTLPLAARGDAFQQRVWELIAAIPYGTTRTYGELAADLGDRPWRRRSGRRSGAIR
jgi:methylated-DNA-[protein]-cysteine S-methyltransferase